LAAHTAENKHHVKWEEVKILGQEDHYKRKIHEAAAMHIESNVISQPSYELPPTVALYIKRREEADYSQPG
jgi:hypothetical protein